MKSKKERLTAIQHIIKDNEVASQEELLNLLSWEGFTLTQATLSRDIKQLKIIKIPNANGQYIYSFQEITNYFHHPSVKPGHDDMIEQGYISIEFSGNLAVIKTRPGYAMAIASHIDQQAIKEILGTIAGDDTILLIIRENADQSEMRNILSEIIPRGRPT